MHRAVCSQTVLLARLATTRLRFAHFREHAQAPRTGCQNSRSGDATRLRGEHMPMRARLLGPRTCSRDELRVQDAGTSAPVGGARIASALGIALRRLHHGLKRRCVHEGACRQTAVRCMQP